MTQLHFAIYALFKLNNMHNNA